MHEDTELPEQNGKAIWQTPTVAELDFSATENNMPTFGVDAGGYAS